jgi:acetyltransferase
MSIRNLEALFQPGSIAVIGASERSGSIGRILTENLLNSGFKGPIYPVNPKYKQLLGVPVYRNLSSLPSAPELAVIATPPATVVDLVDELGHLGTRGVCVISAGFSEIGNDDARMRQQAVLDAARPHTLRVIGPNCLGILVPGVGLNASFAHISPQKGHIAFVAQSGAVITSVLDWAEPRGIGFSHLVSLGNMADVDFGDMLDYLANDARTRAILLYIEAVKHARKFISAARAAARTKPVIVVKAGRHDASARAASSHTGALAGSDAVYDAVFRRAGMLRVFSLEALFDAVETLALARPPLGKRLAILSNGGGIGVMATDALIDAGGELAVLSDETIAKLNQVLPDTWSQANPIDIIGDATGERYSAALRVLLEERNADGILVLNCPTAVASSDEAAQSVVETLPERPVKTVLTSWIGEKSAREPRNRFRKHGVPTYQTPEDAVQAFMQMVNYRQNQAMLMETPPSLPELFQPNIEAARSEVEAAIEDGRDWLSQTEARRVIESYGIPTVATYLVATPGEVAEKARTIGTPVAIKISSPDITHKSDVGGVVLNIEPSNAETAATEMLARVAAAQPEAQLQGFTIQPMIRRGDTWELIAGAFNDRQFGPTILFGHGGTAVEVLDDKALGLPPLNLKLAHQQMARTRIFKLLQGYRDVAAADLDEIAMTLVRLSQLVVDLPEIEELDINPLLAGVDGVVALDARIRVSPATVSGPERLAIRPYPKELEQDIPLSDGRVLLLRPILPEDEPALQAGFAKLTPEEVRFRFFVSLKVLDHMTAARFSQIDYDRQMALVLAEQGIPGQARIYGVVRLIEDPDRERGEFAIVIEREMTGLGLGIYLLRRIIDYARQRGVGEIYGDVLWSNTRMLKLCRALGFKSTRDADEPGVVRVVMPLR